MFPLRFFNVLLLATRALSDDEGETSLSKQHRRMILREHNSRRSDLAFGKAKNKNGKWMPPAKNMYKLKYDMSAERTAIEWANECKWKHSTPKQRKGAGQNMMAIYKQDQADT
ncbi:vespid allergen antigen-like protein, partial [Aphelenchoides avenae]